MVQVVLSAMRVALGFAVGTLFNWGVGQTLQDFFAPHVPRPTSNDSESLSHFLESLPPLAHAGRLLGLGAGVMVGVALVRRMPHGRPMESWTLALLFGLGAVADVLRIPHGNALSVATVALVLPAAWMGIRIASRRR